MMPLVIEDRRVCPLCLVPVSFDDDDSEVCEECEELTCSRCLHGFGPLTICTHCLDGKRRKRTW